MSRSCASHARARLPAVACVHGGCTGVRRSLRGRAPPLHNRVQLSTWRNHQLLCAFHAFQVPSHPSLLRSPRPPPHRRPRRTPSSGPCSSPDAMVLTRPLSLRPEFRGSSSAGHDPEFLASCRHAQETGLKPKTVYRQGVGGVLGGVFCESVVRQSTSARRLVLEPIGASRVRAEAPRRPPGRQAAGGLTATWIAPPIRPPRLQPAPPPPCPAGTSPCRSCMKRRSSTRRTPR